MDDLIANQILAHQREEIDLNGLKPFLQPDMPPADFATPLARWANSGFQSPFTIFSYQFVPPAVCSDGVARTGYDYVCFLIGKSVESQMELFRTYFKDIKILCMVSETTLSIQASRVDPPPEPPAEPLGEVLTNPPAEEDA
jgi:hypothetical protein